MNYESKFDLTIKERRNFKRKFRTVMTFEDEKNVNLNGGTFGTQKDKFLQKATTFLTPSNKPKKSRNSIRANSVIDYECHGGTSDLSIFINGPKPFEPTEKR